MVHSQRWTCKNIHLTLPKIWKEEEVENPLLEKVEQNPLLEKVDQNPLLEKVDQNPLLEKVEQKEEDPFIEKVYKKFYFWKK
jgi:hypothetical protein